MKALLAAIPLIFTSSIIPVQAATSCGAVTIADMNWNSASFMANVDQFILQHGYGCDAELVPGDSVPTTTSMLEKGKPDIAPELWTNASKEALEKGAAEKRLRLAGRSLSDGGQEGFWVPEYMVEQDPSLATIQGVIKNAKKFKHPEDPDLAAFYGCPAGWVCQITTGHLFDALKLKQASFDMIDPGSGAALAGSIAKAYERKQPWFGYYWSPTAVLGKYKMVQVDFGSGIDAEHFRQCITKEDCTTPKVTMFPPGPVYTVTTEAFATRAPKAYQYVSQRSYTNQQMNGLLAWIEDNQADGEESMEYFLNQYPNVWKKWVSSQAANSIEKALKAL